MLWADKQHMQRSWGRRQSFFLATSCSFERSRLTAVGQLGVGVVTLDQPLACLSARHQGAQRRA